MVSTVAHSLTPTVPFEGPTVGIRQHVAVPLTDATRPLYEQLATLKAQWHVERTLVLRYEMARVTQELWKVARNGNGHDKNSLRSA